MNVDGNNAAGMNNRGNVGQRFAEKNGNYSPSTSYNYNNPRTSNANYLPQQQNLRNKRADNNNKFRRPNQNNQNNNNANERIIRQNDIIIRLLKEIRDRLPPPPESQPNAAAEDSSHSYEYQHESEHEACGEAHDAPVAEHPASHCDDEQPHEELASQHESEDEERQPAGI